MNTMDNMDNNGHAKATPANLQNWDKANKLDRAKVTTHTMQTTTKPIALTSKQIRQDR